MRKKCQLLLMVPGNQNLFGRNRLRLSVASDLSASLPYTHHHPFLTHFLIYASGVKSLRLYVYSHMGVSKNRGYPKMDGL